MNPKIHMYTSNEPMLKVNAYIVEADEELVIVDTTLTMSDSKALKNMADALNKPIAGIVLTHGHPDHIAGTYNIAPEGELPIYSLASVKKLMEDTEQAKHKQWSVMFGEEWIPKWVYPNTIVADGQTVKIGALTFKVIDIGSGGDCDANSIWLLAGNNPVAFLGDFIYHQNHSYIADGNVLRWLGNLERYAETLQDYPTYYVGHGGACDFSAIAQQKEYLLAYCANVLKFTDGTGIFTEETVKKFEQAMLAKYPEYGCQFMVSLSAERVGEELVSSLH